MYEKYLPTFTKKIKAKQGGYVLLLTLITTISMFIALSGILSLSELNLSSAKRAMYDISALNVAEAGADNAVFQLNSSGGSYTGTNTSCPISGTGSHPVTQYSDTVKGKATYESCVTAGTIANEKIMYITGKVYRRSTDASPIAARKLRIVAEGTVSAGYVVQTGPGGLIMKNSASIANGPINIGGFLTMSNTATIGSAGSPIATNVANMRCPSPATSTYPTICGSGVLTNPITMNNSAHIYGAVSANGQTNSSGMSNTGLVASSGVGAVVLPDYDRTTQKGAVASTITAAAASCSGSSSVTWPANVHITGSVTMKNNCTVTASGNAWIDGSLSLSNNAILQTNSAVSSTPTIMVDGSGGLSLSNQSKIASNASHIGFQIITFYSTAPCSPNCSSVTGSDLYNSQSVTTVSIGNQGGAANTTFYARWTELDLINGGTIGAILAQTINLSNTGNITFGTSTIGAGTTSYDVKYYEQQ
jgi:hypothetical protein